MAELILKVTPEEVRTKAKQIQDKQQQMEGLMDQMKSLVNGLNDCFDSDSGRLYQEKYTNVTKNIQASLENLKKHVRNLEDAANKYEEVEGTQKTQNQSLSAENIFS